ncbi:MAG TPA: serine hydrolase [Firmicutes bacterium]|jgi:beta-lactamase class A|nr:serine hydrolase [Bacillota bacterium]
MKKIPDLKIYSILSQAECKVGLYVESIDTEEVFEVNPNTVFPSASVIKVPMLALLMKDAQEGRVDLHVPHPIKPENRVSGSGIIRKLDESYVPSLNTLAKLMIILSDNIATNEVMDVIGIERFNAFCLEQGWSKTSLGRKMMDMEAIRQGKSNYTSAGDLGRLLSSVARCQCISKEVSRQVFETMLDQQFRDMLPELIPAIPFFASEADRNSLAPDTVLVANKTGELLNVQHDVGIFVLPDKRRYVIAMFTAEHAEGCNGHHVIAQVSQAVYNALK